MQDLGSRTAHLAANGAVGAPLGEPEPGHKSVLSERFPLRFPKDRWMSFDRSERRQFRHAQLVLDCLDVAPARTAAVLMEETGLRQDDLSQGLGLLDELGLVDITEDEVDDDVIISLVATPEEHLQVRFPDGELRWIFIARPLQEPDVAYLDLN